MTGAAYLYKVTEGDNVHNNCKDEDRGKQTIQDYNTCRQYVVDHNVRQDTY